METIGNMNGMLYRAVTTENATTGEVTTTNGWYPGRILSQWLELRRGTGALEARTKPGVKFKVRSAEDLVDMIREMANDLGILIYPGTGTKGESKVVEDGTLADVNMVVIAQSVEDGSMLAFAGYGLGADNQDKAGGKAMTYAAKASLVQALLAGGKKTAAALGVRDTDDTDTPIQGGVKPKTAKPTLDKFRVSLAEVQTPDDYQELRADLLALTPEDQGKLTEDILAAKKRAGIPLPQPKAKA